MSNHTCWYKGHVAGRKPAFKRKSSIEAIKERIEVDGPIKVLQNN